MALAAAMLSIAHLHPAPRAAVLRRSPPMMSFDATAYEVDRLAKDADAMDAMAAEEAKYADLRTPWKWVIRRRIWDLMEAEDYARQPRPVHHRIPNFVNAEAAALQLAGTEVFRRAPLVKVNPDTPQKPLRQAVLDQRKLLLTPQPRLRTGFFSMVDPQRLKSIKDKREATTSAGVAKFGVPQGLDCTWKVSLLL